jgi:hypothetical protein
MITFHQFLEEALSRSERLQAIKDRRKRQRERFNQLRKHALGRESEQNRSLDAARKEREERIESIRNSRAQEESRSRLKREIKSELGL